MSAAGDRRLHWAPVLSLLCLVHCAACATLGVVVPAWAEAVESPRLEHGLWWLAVLLLVPTVRRAQARARAVLTAGAVGGVAVGLVGHALDHEPLVQASLLAFVVVQSVAVTRRVTSGVACCPPGQTPEV